MIASFLLLRNVGHVAPEIAQLNRSERIPPFATIKKKLVLGNIHGPIKKKSIIKKKTFVGFF